MHCSGALATRLVTALLLLALPALASADGASNVGMGYYGIQSPKWHCPQSLDAFSGVGTPKLAFLWNSFGTSNECLDKFLALQGEKLLEVHLVNAPCQSNNRCGSYELLAGTNSKQYDALLRAKDPATFSALTAYAQAAANAILPRLGGSACYISVFLEDPYSDEAMTNAIAAVRPLFPGCKMVRNPRGINPAKGLAGADVFEDHGPEAKVLPGVPCIVDLDGVDISFPWRKARLPTYIDVSQLPAYIEKYARCDANFLWVAEFNGIDGPKFVDPRARSAYAGARMFEALAPFLEPGE